MSTKQEAHAIVQKVANETKAPQVIHPLMSNGENDWMHREKPEDMTDWQFRFAEVVKPESKWVNLKDMTISQLAREIKKDWKKVNYGAVPYLQAMLSLESVDDKYGCEDGKGIVLYFLSNAGTWRGEVAKVMKAELKARCGV